MGNISRRGFLKGAGLAGAVGAASATGIMGLAGCSNEQAGEGEPQAKQYPYSVHESDVVVIGSGISGLFAAMKALQDGASVTILDKARYGRSGNSGMNWGNMYASMESVLDYDTYMYMTLGSFTTHDGLADQPLCENIAKAFYEAQLTAKAEQLGCILERTKDGNPANFSNAAAGLMPRFFAQKVRRMGAVIYDRTMAQSLLFNEDKTRCVGVVALDLTNGNAHVFRAKSVIMATNGFVWASGWYGIRPHTNSASDLTGEGMAMLLNAGIPMTNAEIMEHDLNQKTPIAVRNTVGSMGIQCTSWAWCYNNEGELFYEKYNKAGAAGQSPFMRACLRELYEGRGTADGGLWADTTNMDQVERFWRRTKEDEYRTLGYEFKDREEVVPHYWNTGLMPYDLSDTCETVISGLYFAGEMPHVFSGGSTNACVGTGWLSGGGAAAAAKTQDLPAVNWADVDAALTGAYAALEREGKDTLRPLDVMRKVQIAFWEGCGPIRDEQGINAMIAELERIKAEELPKVACPDKTRILNEDWRMSMELPGMLDDCLACGYASLKRTCSRGVSFVRSDYPELGEDLYNTVTTYADGVFNVETKPIRDSLQSAADILATEVKVSFAHGLEA